jgi:hypothetical protein
MSLPEGCVWLGLVAHCTATAVAAKLSQTNPKLTRNSPNKVLGNVNVAIENQGPEQKKDGADKKSGLVKVKVPASEVKGAKVLTKGSVLGKPFVAGKFFQSLTKSKSQVCMSLQRLRHRLQQKSTASALYKTKQQRQQKNANFRTEVSSQHTNNPAATSSRSRPERKQQSEAKVNPADTVAISPGKEKSSRASLKHIPWPHIPDHSFDVGGNKDFKEVLSNFHYSDTRTFTCK